MAWAPRDGFVDDEVLGSRDRHLDGAEQHVLGGREGVELERQPGEREIDIDAARRVTQEKHLARSCELNGVVNARVEVETQPHLEVEARRACGWRS